jgi:hypothetical protein
MERKWNISRYTNPYCNPHLAREREEFSIAP